MQSRLFLLTVVVLTGSLIFAQAYLLFRNSSRQETIIILWAR